MQSVSSLKNQIYNKLVEVLNEYDPKIKVLQYQGKIDKQGVVIKELLNTLNSKDSTNTQNLRNVSYDIKIYTTNSKTMHSIEKAEEIQDYIISVMENYFRLKGGFQGMMANANTDNATITTLRYSGTWYVERNCVYN
ncbi:MAG: hypothetical protein R3Y05_01300 [bacterium]